MLFRSVLETLHLSRQTQQQSTQLTDNICRQNRGFWREEFYRHEDPRGREYFWLTGEFVNMEPGADDTDEWALAHGWVSVVPVQTDMTDYRQLKKLGGIFGE